MTKDFKNLANKNAPAKKGATKKDSKPANTPTPGWVWLVTGLCIGILIAAAAYLYLGSASQQNTAAGNTTDKHTGNKTTPKPEPEKAPRFGFYKELPAQEIKIPESEIRAEQKRLKPKENVHYILQVASFRSFDDADALRAKLAINGIESNIQRVTGEGGEWLRVRVGPFSNNRDMNRVRNRLHDQNLNPMLVKIPQ